jgi:tRNA threonylcarbamoyladenosine biosynthesis protein TsaB
VILLAIDTCDTRGSVAVLRDAAVLQIAVHDSAEEYSSWLLPAVDGVLESAGIKMQDVEVYAAACGPGSFTGVRVGLTTVKAWSEVYGRPIAAVSRLEALASQSTENTAYVTAFLDAHREQVFGALYRRNGVRLERIGDEAVIAPGEFVEWVGATVGSERVVWVSPDMECVAREGSWAKRQATGDLAVRVEAKLAGEIGKIGYRMALENGLTDALALDANYVRRTDAEIHWRSGTGHGRGR